MIDLSYRNNINKDYNLKNINKCKELLKNKLPEINEGYSTKIFKVESNDCGSVILKKFKNEVYSVKDRKKVYVSVEGDKIINKEINFLKLCNQAITNFYCPNFMQMYDFNIKENYIITEYFDEDSDFLYDNIFYKQKYYDTYMIQFLMGLYYLEKRGYRHGDFHQQNVLKKNIEKNILFRYKIDDKIFYVPTYGFLYAVIDFNNAYPIKIKKISDTLHFAEKINITIRKNNVKKYLKIYKTIDDFLKNFNNDVQKEIINNSTISNDLSSYISYAIKKNYLKIYNDKLNEYVYKIKDIFKEDKNIKEILEENFDEYKIYKKKYDKYKIIDFTL